MKNGGVTNKDIAKILFEISEYLQMDDVPFKPRAYEKAGETIAAQDEELAGRYARGGMKALQEIPGVGVAIAEKIEELLKTGKIDYYEKLKKKMPVDLAELSSVPGVGPKHVKTLYKKLKVRNIEDLARVAHEGKIRKLPGFGQKSEERIIQGLAFLQKGGMRRVLGYFEPTVLALADELRKLKVVHRLDIAGSFRRRRETIGDVDMLAVSKRPKEVIDRFVSLPEVEAVVAKGETKSAVRLRSGLDLDLRVIPQESYGAALLYFTGSKEHNVKLREIAMRHGLKLNEYGLFKGKRAVAAKTEEEVYKALGLRYIEPELREDTGEIEAAQKNALPRLVAYGDLRGDLQVQTTWTDGAHSIEAMAEAARKAGLEYIAITDHTQSLKVARGLDEKRIQEQWEEIDQVNASFKAKNIKFTVLKGTECDILKDGSLDLKDEILAKLDVVGVSVHSHFNLSEEEQTERIIRAISNPHVDILFHPTGRIINRRDAYRVNMEKIIQAAKKYGVALEIDAFPERSDLKDEYIRKCVEAGVKMTIDSDAHAKEHFAYLKFGIAQARRGWAKREDILNTKSVAELLRILRK